MVEKPGSFNKEEYEELVDYAEEKGVIIYINYQREFHPKLAQLFAELKAKTAEGYTMEYCSVYSCDKARWPQPAQQYLNQGCHDYALTLSILKSCNLNIIDLQARGCQWDDINDTRFVKATGMAGNGTHKGIFDIQMGRVCSTGTFTEMYVKMSKINKANIV